MGKTIMADQLILRNCAALAVLTVAVIAVEFLPTGASAQNQIIQSLRPSGKNQPPSHVFRVGGHSRYDPACAYRCWCTYCGCTVLTAMEPSYHSIMRVGRTVDPRVAIGFLGFFTNLETTHYVGVETHGDI